jgi:hypothetical protein
MDVETRELGRQIVDRAIMLEAENKRLREFADWVDTWTSNPVGAYSSHALMGLFAMTQDKLAALQRS